MDDLLNLPVRQLGEAVRSRQISAKQVMRTYLDRIEAVNPGLNAVVHLEADMAMKYAERADLALQSGETPGRLFGVPMTIKDSLDTFDMISTWGTTGRREFRPGEDATCVARLRNEGAILMGKTNTPEFTLSFKTDNLVFGETRNPYDPERTPGGSSGGAAASIASQATPFDVGTDTGGSIRLPSHFCGIAGIKPTTGRVPCTGNALPSSGLIAPLSQPGPMARHVDDLVLLLEIMQGVDNIDPHAVPAPWNPPSAVDVSRLRIGYHTDNGIKTPDAPVADAITGVIDLLNDRGFKTDEVRPTGVEMAGFLYARVLRADNGDLVDMLLQDAGTSDPSPAVAPLIGHNEPGITAEEFSQVISLWHNYQGSMLSYFDRYDVLICPVNAHTAIKLDESEDFAAYTYTAAYNLTGWPGLVIRCGTDPGGLPIGVQILAAPFREDHCLALGLMLEETLGEFPGPPL